MKVGIIQISCSADTEANKRKLADGIRRVSREGARLVVLQELHNTLYFCQTESVDLCALAEPVPGPSTEFYGALARECGVDTPLMEETDAILSGRKKPADAVLSLMRRDPRAERD